jgi:hypothetical protein
MRMLRSALVSVSMSYDFGFAFFLALVGLRLVSTSITASFDATSGAGFIDPP